MHWMKITVYPYIRLHSPFFKQLIIHCVYIIQVYMANQKSNEMENLHKSIHVYVLLFDCSIACN